ncbi:hypothetical protein OKW41_006151 [Paraburkholderia sp. UCT70]|uniref:hypothetical protein n=1 Tax=Paraburkholderia sp. UCT70 TaxID=2991068 RepID=UPI003D22ADFD
MNDAAPVISASPLTMQTLRFQQRLAGALFARGISGEIAWSARCLTVIIDEERQPEPARQSLAKHFPDVRVTYQVRGDLCPSLPTENHL